MGWSPGTGAFGGTVTVSGFSSQIAVNNGNNVADNGSAELDLVGSQSPGQLHDPEVSLYVLDNFAGPTEAFGLDARVDGSHNFILLLGSIDAQADAAIVIQDAAEAETPRLGFYGVTPVVRPAAVTAPSGGTTVDTQARAAIVSLINLLSAAAGGNGLTA